MADYINHRHSRRQVYKVCKDVYYTSRDGTKYLLARAGATIPRDQAVRLGLVKELLPPGPQEHK